MHVRLLLDREDHMHIEQKTPHESPALTAIGIVIALLSGIALSLFVFFALIYQGSQSPVYHLIGNVLFFLIPAVDLSAIILVQIRKRRNSSALLQALFIGLIAFASSPVLLLLISPSLSVLGILLYFR